MRLFALIVIWGLTAVFAVGALKFPGEVGKPREPVSAETCAIAMIIAAALAVASAHFQGWL